MLTTLNLNYQRNLPSSDIPASSSIKHIVLFIHLHKAGGTKVVRSFKISNYTLFEPNGNGNPWDRNHNDILFGMYNNEEMNKFKDELISQNVTFIAMESHFFVAKHKYFEYVKQLKLFDVFTMIRDPLKRIISNYYFDEKRERPAPYLNLTALDQFDNLDDKMVWFCTNTSSVYNYNNYYIRLLNGIQDQKNIEIMQHHFETAKDILSQFDAIGILEFKSTWIMLENRYGINLSDTQIVNGHKGIMKIQHIDLKMV